MKHKLPESQSNNTKQEYNIFCRNAFGDYHQGKEILITYIKNHFPGVEIIGDTFYGIGDIIIKYNGDIQEMSDSIAETFSGKLFAAQNISIEKRNKKADILSKRMLDIGNNLCTIDTRSLSDDDIATYHQYLDKLEQLEKQTKKAPTS